MRLDVDVLIIGGGISACAAAIEAAKYGLKVAVADKGVLGRSGSSPTSGSGINAAFDHIYSGIGPAQSGDSPENHFADSWAGGDYVNDPRLVRQMVHGIKPLILESESWGLRYSKAPDGRFYQIQAMGCRYPRTVFVLGGGPAMMEALRKEVFHRGVRVIEETFVAELVVRNGRVCGAAGCNRSTGEPYIFIAKAVVLAAGSATGLYQFASANFKTTGDAFVLAYRAGAKLTNMEFVEFTVIPKVGETVISSGGISPFVGRGSHIVNAAGERFLLRHDPEKGERTERALLARAIFLELREGRGPVYNVADHFTDEVWADLEKVDRPRLSRLEAAGLDYRKENFEWTPAVHTFLGGILIDPDCFTGVPGLFAAGECANSVHGSNRVSGNALSECLFFGKRAGRSAAMAALSEKNAGVDGDSSKRLLKRLSKSLEKSLNSTERTGKIASMKKELRTLAWDHIGLVRNRESLEAGVRKFSRIRRALDRIEASAESAEYVSLCEARNLSLVGEMVARAAILREESRGQHFREDHPRKDDENWKKWLVFHEGSKGIEYTIMQVPEAE